MKKKHSGTDRRIILASSSYRRQEMMKWLGIPFEVVPSDFPEEQVNYADFSVEGLGHDPEGYAVTIAQGKALTVAEQHPDALVVASDTVVFLDGNVYGKPKNLDDARAMLKTLRGKTHTVFSAVVMIDGETGERRSDVVRSDVTFVNFPDAQLEQYIATSEPYDKAGGYALQGFAKRFVKDVEGSATNVVGFPVLTVRDMLEDLGVPVGVNLEKSVVEKTGYRS